MAGVRDGSKEETPIHGARAGSGGCRCGCAWGERCREEAWSGTELREPVGAAASEACSGSDAGAAACVMESPMHGPLGERLDVRVPSISVRRAA